MSDFVYQEDLNITMIGSIESENISSFNLTNNVIDDLSVSHDSNGLSFIAVILIGIAAACGVFLLVITPFERCFSAKVDFEDEERF